ncbi:MAG: hypothetical protein ABSB26_05395 [Nitrososphaerales archaeon]|jgi:hypothetical protein
MGSDPERRPRPWDWLLANMRVRELLALIGDLINLVAIFVPWIYGFSAPSGQSLQVSLVAAPDLVDLILHSNYVYLVGIPVGLAFGLGFALTSMRTRKLEKVILICLAFALCLFANFMFGLQFGSAIDLVMDGKYVSYSITLGPGSRLVQVSSSLYFFSLFIMILTE